MTDEVAHNGLLGGELNANGNGFALTPETCTSKLSECEITQIDADNSTGVESHDPSVDNRGVHLPADLEDVSGLDPDVVERAFLLFIDKSLSTAKTALYETRHALVDKILCNIFKKLHDVYAKEGDDKQTFAKLVDAKGYFPLLNLEENIPASVPESIVTKLKEVASDRLYIYNLVERLLVLDALTLFNIQELRDSCENFRQPIIGELWPAALKSVLEPQTEESDLPINNLSAKLTSFHGKLDVKNLDFEPVDADEVTEEEEEEVSPFSDDFKLTKQPDAVTTISKTVAYKSLSKMFSLGSKKLFKQINKLKVKNEEEGWVTEPHKNLETIYRMENDIITVKVRGRLPYNLLKILTIINETELSSAWIPFVKDATDLHAYTKTSKLVLQKCDYPIMGIKETVLYGLSTNVLEEANCVVIVCRNPPNNQGEFEKFSKILQQGGFPDTTKVLSCEEDDYTFLDHVMEKFSVLNYQRGQEICFVLFPINDEHTILEFYANIMLEAKIPMSFVKFIVKRVASGMYKKIAQQGKRFDDGPFTECIKRKREFYSWMEKIYEEYKLVNAKANGEKFKDMGTYDPNQEL